MIPNRAVPGRVRRGMAVLLLTVVATLAVPAEHPAQSVANGAVAIVAHPNAPVSDLTSAQLRSIFLGEQQFWPDRSRITLLVRAPAAPEREVVLNRIYRMSEAHFRQYWIAKMFRAEVPAGPRNVQNSAMTRELVNAIPGSIAFLPASEVGPDMKVLRIDGRLPGDAGYPIR
jgi:ABC-type phosphate transport system substrate-binding protein